MRIFTGIATVLLLICAVTVSAKDRGKGHGRGDDDKDHGNNHGGSTVIVQNKIVVSRFAPRDRDVIVTYFQKEKKHKRLPPGLAKRLPREVEQKIVINAIAPPEVLQAMIPMPPLLLPMLPPPPPGFMMMTVGGKALQINAQTHVVVDVFDLGL